VNLTVSENELATNLATNLRVQGGILLYGCIGISYY